MGHIATQLGLPQRYQSWIISKPFWGNKGIFEAEEVFPWETLAVFIIPLSLHSKQIIISAQMTFSSIPDYADDIF